jgi:hypothetical protein
MDTISQKHDDRDEIKRRAKEHHQRPTRRQAFNATARLVAICWASQLKDAGELIPPLRKLTAQVLREVRQ